MSKNPIQIKETGSPASFLAIYQGQHATCHQGSCLSLQLLETQLDTVLRNLLLLTLLELGGCTRETSEVPSHLKYSVI